MPNASKSFSKKSLWYILLFVFFTALFLSYFHLITATTQDLGRHLLTGKLILTTHNVPKINLYSYTYPDFPFINHHWLSEVIFYLLFSMTGFTGLLFTTTAVVLLSFFLLVKKAIKVSTPLVIFAVLTLLLGILLERTDLRPELFSFLFLSVFIVVLQTYKQRFTRFIFLLPLLELLWVNMHIYFFIGLVVFGLYFLDVLITRRTELFSKSNKLFFLAFFLTFTAALINPNGLTGALYPLHVLQNYGYTIQENQNIFFLQSLSPKPTILFFEASVLLLFISLFLNVKRTKPIDWLLSVSFTVLGGMAIRNFPLFVVAVFLPFTTHASAVLKKLGGVFPTRYMSVIKVMSSSVLCLFLFLMVKGQVARLPVTASYDKGAEQAVTYFIDHNLRGPIFNNFDIGSYLEYRLYPKERVFVDGRPEAYPASFFKDVYIPMQENPEAFVNIQNKYDFQTILFSHTDQTPWGEQFITWITKDPAWKAVYLDDTMIILTKDSERKALNDDPAIITPYHASRKSLLQLAHFFSIAQWPRSLKATLLAILKLDPKNCPALGNLAYLMQSQNDPSSVVYATMYQSSCP